MTDILDRLKQQHQSQGDIIDQLYKDRRPQPSEGEDKFNKKMAIVEHFKSSGGAGSAFLADIGATITKTLPNLKRFINPEDKEAIKEIKEIEEFQDTLRLAFPSAVFGGEVALPALTATATMGLSALPAVAVGATEAAALSKGDQNPRTNAAIAGVLPFIPDAVKKLGSAGGEIVEQFARRTGDVLEATPEKQAGRALKRFADDANVNPEAILKERAALGEGSTLADVPSMQGLAQGAALTPSGKSYTKIFEKLLDGIDIKLNVDYLTDKEKWDKMGHNTIFTGQIDKYLPQISTNSTNFLIIIREICVNPWLKVSITVKCRAT